MGSSTEKANNGFSEEEQRIFSQLEDLQRKKLFIMKCLEMPELEETALVSPWDLTELSLIPRTNLIILPGEAGNVKSFIGTSSDFIYICLLRYPFCGYCSKRFETSIFVHISFKTQICFLNWRHSSLRSTWGELILTVLKLHAKTSYYRKQEMLKWKYKINL